MYMNMNIERQNAIIKGLIDREDKLCSDGQRVVPVSLQDEMLDLLTVNPRCEIAVLFSPVMAVKLVFMGFKRVTLVGTVNAHIECLTKFGINLMSYEEYKESNVEFNLTLGNPPYSLERGNKLLYPEFFEMSLEKSDHVVMLMPIKLESNDNKIIKHNVRVLRHNTRISEDVSHHFKGISVGRISYVCASSDVENEFEMPEKRELPTLLPSRDRMRVINGRAFTPVKRGCEVMHKVHKDGIVYDKCSSEERNKFRDYFKKHSDATLPWMVMINHTPSRGIFNCEIVKYDPNMVWSRWVYAIQAKTKSEANEIIEHLHSKSKVEFLNENMTSHTVSKTILEALPSHVE